MFYGYILSGGMYIVIEPDASGQPKISISSGKPSSSL